jgi:hypothetical protein
MAATGSSAREGRGRKPPVADTLAGRFASAFRALFVRDEASLIIALAEAELAPHGGPLFDGDRRVAPSSWRVG